ncbi:MULTISPECIES: hypothetical protein [Klebsiella]|uniref:hypothetical protein n=1 Tax=Klebsiella TaxID=570 RepID=UPI000ADEC4DA|nr:MULTISPECIES: hypothetical protein [Klebsiella]MDH0487407.1 hypothetical protein [Klebsiella michiganensis]MDM4110739.1 hypothetical protein [Klebsiella michiganensis]MDM4344721.1 hypothetical protein [Klebsiella michiganensis]MDM4350145.1 hypothetical protein [Klebsiella michiganensis]HDS6468093.1 hypothetical protein [Klebsiella michiganensis]
MSFIINKKVSVVKYYPELCNASSSSDSETVSVTVTVESLDALIGQHGTIKYSMKTTNGGTGMGMFDFIYSGSGNPMKEAEEALKLSLS